MYTHPDILIVHTYRCSYGITTIPDDLNTLSYQSVGENDAPRDPIYVPVTSPTFAFHTEEDTSQTDATE